MILIFRLTKDALIILGCVLMIIGIIRGSIFADQIFTEMSVQNTNNRGMFSAGKDIDADRYKSQRAKAIRQYRGEYPNGAKYKQMRYGQLLTVAGICFVLLGGLVAVAGISVNGQ